MKVWAVSWERWEPAIRKLHQHFALFTNKGAAEEFADRLTTTYGQLVGSLVEERFVFETCNPESEPLSESKS